MNILIAIFSFILILLCLFTVLVVMVQKPKGDGGMGAALGGGSMEAALGAETSSLLTRVTIYVVIGFFVLTFMLYLGNISVTKAVVEENNETLLSEIVQETAAEAEANTAAADSALQQVLELNQEAATDADAIAVDVVDQAETAAEEAGVKAEKVTNP